MTNESIEALLAKRQRAWAARDLAALLQIYSDDCVVETPTAGSLRGRPAVEDGERKLFAAFPDIAIEGEELILMGNRAVMTATATGTDQDGTLLPVGTAFRVPIVVLFTIRNDQIAMERRIWDFSGLLLQRVQKDLDVAAAVQQMLLPQGAFSGHGFEVAAASVPCRSIGGDFFDYFDLPDGGLALALGDVAGKGPPAALLSASLQAILACRPSNGAAATLEHVNRAMLRRAVPSRFATLVYAHLSSDGRLTYSIGGHNPPLVVGRSGRRWLRQGGTVVGMFEGATFEEETVLLDEGDQFVAFSDGITEALDTSGTEFGDDRLASCVEASRDLAPAALVDHILETVQQFSAGTRQGDDLTVLVLARTRGRTG